MEQQNPLTQPQLIDKLGILTASGLPVQFMYNDQKLFSRGLNIKSVTVEDVYNLDDVMDPVIGTENLNDLKIDLVDQCGFTKSEAEDHVTKNTKKMIVVYMESVRG